MRRFVVVEASSSDAATVLHARCDDTSFGVRLGRTDAGRRPVSGVDEHFAVDVDVCRDGSVLDCADVLRGSRALAVADALRRLADLTSDHPARGLAAVPLSGVGDTGGWAAAGGTDRAVVLLPTGAYRLYGPRGSYESHHAYASYAASGERSLLPSCLHAWLVAGRSLREWPYAHVVPTG